MKRCLRRAPTRPWPTPPRLYLARLFVAGGDHRRALALYRAQRAATGPTASLLHSIAEGLKRGGDEAGHRETLMELMERYAASRMALRVASRFRPRTIDERYTRAQVYARHGDDRAISDLQQVVRNAPGHDLAPHAAYALGRALGRSGQFDRARATYRRLYDDHGWAPALYRIAGLDVRDGRDLEAIEAYVDLSRKHPRHPLADDALWQAAKAAERKGHFERAGSIHAELASRFPSSEHAEDASWGAGFSLYCRERFEEAAAGFAELSRKGPPAAPGRPEPLLGRQERLAPGARGGGPAATSPTRPSAFRARTTRRAP